jgi:hypothetical protein
MSSSRNSSHQRSDRSTSNQSIEEFTLRQHGSTIAIVFLVIVAGVLGYFLWDCRKNSAKAIAASSA